MNDRVFIHYGSRSFDPEAFTEIKNKGKRYNFAIKPFGGLWACDVNARYSWKDFCEGEEFRLDTLNESFKFKLSNEARVLTLKKLKDLNPLPKEILGGFVFLDFEELKKTYDVIEYYEDGDLFGLRGALYGWDCDCVLVLNKDVVEPLR